MNYFDTDNRKFAKEFVDYGIFSTDDTLPYKASENSAMGEYVHPLNDMKNIKLTKPKLHGMKKNRIKMTESQLNRVIRESVNTVLNEISASLADKAAGAAYKKAREGFGAYEPYNEIPNDSYHGKKFAQGEKFMNYRHNKLSRGQNDVGIYYVGKQIALKNYKTGELLTKPCDSIEELENELGI